MVSVGKVSLSAAGMLSRANESVRKKYFSGDCLSPAERN